MPDLSSEYFSEWFASMAQPGHKEQMFDEGLGLPPEIAATNVLPFSGLQEIAAALAVPTDGLLVDIACGRGGPGLWIARELGCRLTGVDFSEEAIRQASERRNLFGLAERAEFQVGTLDATGLAADAADALICIDAFQFATDGAAAASEFRRVMRPGAQAIITTWEAVDGAGDSLSERIRGVRLAESLAAAGFKDVSVLDRSDWHDTARQMWSNITAVDPGDDPAMKSAYDEGLRSLESHDQMRRVMATAIA